MSYISDISLKTSLHGGWLLLLIIISVATAYAVYRRTVPPISTFWRVILVNLRTLSIVLVLLLLFEPILRVTRKKLEKPVIAVLVDDSASMSLVDEKVDRPAELRKALAAPIFEHLGKDNELVFYRFNHVLSEPMTAMDSLALKGDGTDLGHAMTELDESLAEHYFAAAVLLTDGASNLGENPARYAKQYKVPIYPIAIGDPAEQRDVLISNFVTNEIAYAGKQVPVDVYIKSNGFGGDRIAVQLTHEGQVIESKMLQLSDQGLEYKVRLHFTPEQEGVHKYEIHLPNLEGELTDANNNKSFYTKVLKSKLRVLVLSGGPGPDFSFLKRALESDENIEVTSVIEKQSGRFYNQPDFQSWPAFDCFILLDFPRKDSRTEPITQLRKLFAEGKPAMCLLGKHTDANALSELQEFLPFSKPVSLAGAEKNVFLQVLPQGMHHPIMRVYEDDLENADSWSDLPPVFSNGAFLNNRPGAVTLATVDKARSNLRGNRPIPLVTVYDSGKRKSLAVMAYGLWRWDLLVQGLGKLHANYSSFLRNSVRWLTTEDDSKLVRVTPNKEIYRSGEEVKFTAQVYFEDYQPVDGAEVAVQLTGSGGNAQELTLNNIGDGRYEGNFRVLEGGDYKFSATAHQQGRILGRDAGRFSVEEFSLEFQNTRMNEALLRSIAAGSGGEFYYSSNFSALEDKLKFPEKYITLENEWEIWKQTPVLIACVLLLSVEWFIRKRKGML